MNTIVIKVIPQHEQRYVTVGDYWDDPDGTKQVRISDLGDWRMELLVALHELIETALCDVRGIAEPDVMQFDMDHPETDDPGALPEAPYHAEHTFAEHIEWRVAQELGVNWEAYGARIKGLFG